MSMVIEQDRPTFAEWLLAFAQEPATPPTWALVIALLFGSAMLFGVSGFFQHRYGAAAQSSFVLGLIGVCDPTCTDLGGWKLSPDGRELAVSLWSCWDFLGVAGVATGIVTLSYVFCRVQRLAARRCVLDRPRIRRDAREPNSDGADLYECGIWGSADQLARGHASGRNRGDAVRVSRFDGATRSARGDRRRRAQRLPDRRRPACEPPRGACWR